MRAILIAIVFAGAFAVGVGQPLSTKPSSDSQAGSLTIASVQACEDLHKEDNRCECTSETCGSLKDCTAGWVPCNNQTPAWACDTPGHEGEKCIYDNDGDFDNECPPEYCSPGGGGGSDPGGGGGTGS